MSDDSGILTTTTRILYYNIWIEICGHFFLQKKTNKRFGSPRTNGDVPRRGSTLVESSDENIGLISGMSARSLTALRHFEIGSVGVMKD